MNKDNNYVIIMAGGIGTRFWPFSRVNRPKQFQDILGIGKSLIQMTAARFADICPDSNIYVVTNADYYDLVKQQLPQLSDDQILLEPFMRNTAPCIAYGAYKIAAKNPDANIVVAPADHVILKEDAFTQALETALEATAQQEMIVTLGITPTRPDTGYGYIQMDNGKRNGGVQKVKTFTEKPNLELAIEFVDSGDYLWNAGLFVFNARTIQNSFGKHLPKMYQLFEDIKTVFHTPQEAEAIQKTYGLCPNVSIDYGVMEKADNVYVLKCDLGWSDLGTWKSMYEYAAKNDEGNVISGNVMTYQTQNCIVKAPADRLVVVQGLDNFIVVEHNHVLLICHKDQEQSIKQMLEDVKQKHGNRYA